MDPLKRFSTRAENYAKYRPGYPPAVIGLLENQCGLNTDSVVADIGSGTGILSELFLKKGCCVLGVEPNEAMRLTAERLLQHYPNFSSVAGTAESTTLSSGSVDFITAGQAFHWFDHENAKREFARILKPRAWIVLVWNERQLDTTPFLSSYEDLLLRYGTDYSQIRHETVLGAIDEFFSPEQVQCVTFENAQHFDFESLKGRVQSASYTPEQSAPEFEPMMVELRRIFDAHQVHNTVTFLYATKVYYGRASQSF